MNAEDLRVVLLSLVPEKRVEQHGRMFFEQEEYAEHRAEVAGWNSCRDAFIDSANKVYRDALNKEEKNE